MKPRLGFIEIHQAPYRSAALEMLENRGNVQLTVISLFPIDYGHAYRPKIVPSYHSINLTKCIHFSNYSYYHPAILQTLIRNDFDVIVVSGYRELTSQMSILYCLLGDKTLIFSMDSILFPNNNGTNVKKLREFFLRKFFSVVDSFWVPGEASKRYLQTHGVEENRIFQGAYCLDRGGIVRDYEKVGSSRNHIRAELGVYEKDWLFLFVGRIEPFRGVIYLIKAFSKLEKEIPESHLLIIGEGSDRANIESECRKNNLRNVIFFDPMPMDRLIRYYVAADTYVMPGLRENYSLALAQAAICGLPIISTDTVGAIEDYVVDGHSGFIVKSADSDSLYKYMYLFVIYREIARTMGKNSKETSIFRTPDWAAIQLESAVLRALQIHNYKR